MFKASVVWALEVKRTVTASPGCKLNESQFTSTQSAMSVLLLIAAEIVGSRSSDKATPARLLYRAASIVGVLVSPAESVAIG